MAKRRVCGSMWRIATIVALAAGLDACYYAPPPPGYAYAYPPGYYNPGYYYGPPIYGSVFVGGHFH